MKKNINVQFIISWFMYFIGFIGFVAFLSAVKTIDTQAWLYSLGACVGVLLFSISGYLRSDNIKTNTTNNKTGLFNSINQTNSSLGVQCNSKEVCCFRYTTTCKTCKHNCGMKQDQNCYEPQ